MPDSSDVASDPSAPSLGALARIFLRISLLGFGGPNAHLALMLDEVVDRRGWITREHFLQLVGVTNLLPGPNSSEVAIHIGYTQRGWTGALATGLAFVFPTFVLVVLFSSLYFRYGTVPQVEGVFWGLKPAVLAIILGAGWKLAGVAMEPEKGPGFGGNQGGADRGERGPTRPGQTYALRFLALGGVASALLLDRWEVAAMALGGLVGWTLFREGGTGGSNPHREESEGDVAEPGLPTQGAHEGKRDSSGPGISLFLPLSAPGALAAAQFPPLLQIFGLMLGTGAVLFGGGYMLVALLEPFVVDATGWLTPQEFLDGIALTQAIPGPIVTLVAFVGYAVAGVPGAAVATAGIYLPSFGAVLAVAPHLDGWRKRNGIRAALKGVNAVVAGAILGVGLTLIPPAIQDPWGAVLLLVALAAITLKNAKAIWVVGGGVVAGAVHLFLVG